MSQAQSRAEVGSINFAPPDNSAPAWIAAAIIAGAILIGAWIIKKL